jgi:hypothetical protein
MMEFSDWRDSLSITLDRLLVWAVLRDANAVQRTQGEWTGTLLISCLETAGTPLPNGRGSPLRVALRKILGHLAKGDLRCRAVRHGRRDWINEDDWRTLRFNFAEGSAFDAAGIEYSDLRFPVDEALKVFPEKAEAGQITEHLLTAASESAEADLGAALIDGDVEAPKATVVGRLAEWIFAQHLQATQSGNKSMKKDALEEKAHKEMKSYGIRDFNDAFKLVYRSKKRRPPRDGWPLQPEYQKRLAEDTHNRST